MFVDFAQQCFAVTPQANFPAHNLNFQWSWRWWDQIQATFQNIFCFKYYKGSSNNYVDQIVLTDHLPSTCLSFPHSYGMAPYWYNLKRLKLKIWNVSLSVDLRWRNKIEDQDEIKMKKPFNYILHISIALTATAYPWVFCITLIYCTYWPSTATVDNR